jgi:hypothetical protein
MKCSELFKQIEEFIPALGGWASPERCCQLAATVVAIRPLVTVEIGVWMGRQSLSCALAHKFIGRGKVWAVDPWSGKAAAAGQDAVNAEWWGEQAKHDLAYQQFGEAAKRLGVEEFLHVQRATSDEATTPEAIGLLLVDGNHGEQAIKDVERWAPLVVRGGVVFLDDLNWSGGAVTEAGNRLLKQGFAPITAFDEGVFYQRAS